VIMLREDYIWIFLMLLITIVVGLPYNWDFQVKFTQPNVRFLLLP